MLSATRKEELKQFCKLLNINADIEILDIALTHPSYYSESGKIGEDYERLEFLGDSALRLVMSNYLFDKYFEFDEGKLTKLRSFYVSDAFLAQIALKLGSDQYLNIGKHEEKDGGRTKESVLACSTEAVFGAIFKSSGFEAVKKFIYDIYESSQTDVNEILNFYNPKEILQQYTQDKNKDLPQYKILSETGKQHNKIYEAGVFYEGEQIGVGKGKTKKEAEKNAATEAIKKLNINGDI